MRISVFIFFAVLSVWTTQCRAATDGYHQINAISVPGDGGWDYLTVDAPARRVYVSHGSAVEILDADSGKLLGRIDNLQGVHGIALAPDLGRGFISDGKANEVVIFDLKTMAVAAKVAAGQNPDAIVYDPASKKVFAFNGKSSNATVIDAEKSAVTGIIDLGGKPEFAVSDGKGHVFDNLEDKSELLELDATEQKIAARWPLAPCEEPSALAIDPQHHRLFAGCHNRLLAVVNADSGKVVASVPIGEGVDAAVFDARTSLVMTSNGEGTITVIHQDTPDTYHVVDTVKTRTRSRTFTLDEKNHRLFVPAAEFSAAAAATTDKPHPRPAIIPGSFSVLVFEAPAGK